MTSVMTVRVTLGSLKQRNRASGFLIRGWPGLEWSRVHVRRLAEGSEPGEMLVDFEVPEGASDEDDVMRGIDELLAREGSVQVVACMMVDVRRL